MMTQASFFHRASSTPLVFLGLFAADVSSGATHQIESWSLNVATIPEPSFFMFGVTAAAVAFLRRKQGR